MGTYRFQAFDSTGTLLEAEIESESLERARELVWARGATPISIRPTRASQKMVRDLSAPLGGITVKDVKLAALVRDLAVLLQAGVPLENALRMAANVNADRRARKLAQRLLEGVLTGAMLAHVMSGTKELHHQEYVKIVEAGELSGDLGGALRELADLMDRRIEIRNRIRAALTYPILLICLAAISVSVILGLLLPAITPIFRENGGELPAIIGLLDFLRDQWWSLVAAGSSVALLAAVAISVARRRPAYRSRLDQLYLRIPLVGPISQMREAARFARTLATLLRAGVPLLQALIATCPIIKNAFMREALEGAASDVSHGASLAAASASRSALPPVVTQMIAVGEETGRLQDMLLRASTILERQEQDRTARILSILGPTVTIGVAGLVAIIILSVVSGILAINDLVLR